MADIVVLPMGLQTYSYPHLKSHSGKKVEDTARTQLQGNIQRVCLLPASTAAPFTCMDFIHTRDTFGAPANMEVNLRDNLVIHLNSAPVSTERCGTVFLV